MEGGVEGGCSFDWDTLLDSSIEMQGPILWTQAVRPAELSFCFSLPPPPFFLPFAEKYFSKWKILIIFYTKRAKALIICFNTSKHSKVTYNQVFTDWCIKMLLCQLLPCIYDVRILLHYSFLLLSHADHCDPCQSLWMQMVVESPFHHRKSFP